MRLTPEQIQAAHAFFHTLTSEQAMTLALALDTMEERPTAPVESATYDFVNSVHDLIADHMEDA